jgi:hypothetical protein
MGISKDTLGLAGEFAAASELCHRGIYAQLTLGNRKRTDLLVECDLRMIRVQGKAKQNKVWPASKGVYGSDIILVLVDYQHKAATERPDFYILTPADWVQIVIDTLTDKGWRGPDGSGPGDWVRVVTGPLSDAGKVNDPVVKLSPEYIPTWPDAFIGMSLTAKQVAPFKEAWEKIDILVGRRGM